MESFWQWVEAVDRCVAGPVPLLVAWILVSATDDLFILLVWLSGLPRRRLERIGRPVGVAERLVAIYVPCWHEDAVIERMIEHNMAAIRYEQFHVFIGVYPNDPGTRAAAGRAERRFPERVHMVVGPNAGPTSKADCLNAVDRARRWLEAEKGIEFGLILLHDAEDMIHPDELTTINRLAGRFAMIQTPVLAQPTPWHHWVHGIYCDDFAEFHSKDIPVRWALGGFVPSAGVGTAFRRDAIEALRAGRAEGPFAPDSLTEDYECGFRLHRVGLPQVFLPVGGSNPATRELFPATVRQAIRQRTRWTIGIALQGWKRHGWQSPYWFWRDRKGLIGAPASLAMNLMTLYGGLTWALARLAGRPWGLGGVLPAEWLWCIGVLGGCYMVARVQISWRVYGWKHGVTAPPRLVLANYINAMAVFRAIGGYLRALAAGKTPEWAKTEHDFAAAAPVGEGTGRLRIGEILLKHGRVGREQLVRAVSTKPGGRRLGEHLVRLGLVTERDVYEALSEQTGIPLAVGGVRRLLPAGFVRRHRLAAVEVSESEVVVAGPDFPSKEARREFGQFTKLPMRFHWMEPGRFAAVAGTSGETVPSR